MSVFHFLIHRIPLYSKIFMPFQLKLANQISYIEKFSCLFKLKLANQISYVSVDNEKMKLCMILEHF